MYVIPSLQVGGGILSGIGGTALLGTCETVVGCVAGGYLIASGSDDIVAGSKNWGVEPAKQSATAREEILRSLGMSPTGAMWSSLALDLSAGGTGAFSDIARVNRLNAATNAEIDAARIENNVNIDNPSLTTSRVREFKATANHPITYRAENINTGQVVDRDGLVRVDSAKSSNDAQVATNLGLASSRDLDYYSTGYPAWKPNTVVTERIITQPETMRMVIDERQYNAITEALENGDIVNASKNLGSWATKESINSVQDMRQRLAVTEDFKPTIKKDGTPNKFYVVEFEVPPGIGVREGIAGTMYDNATGRVMRGGVKQINFVQGSPYSNPSNFKINPSIKEIR